MKYASNFLENTKEHKKVGTQFTAYEVERIVNELEEYHAKDCAEHERKINTSWLLAILHITGSEGISIQMKQKELIEKLR